MASVQSRSHVAILVTALVAVFGPGARDVNAVSLPALINFDNDVAGQPPTTGGAGQPTSLFVSPGTSILVQSSANGLNTKPVVLTAQAPNQPADVGIGFDPLASGTLRVEATVAFNRLVDGFFLQTTVPGFGAIVTRLIVLSDGTILDDASRTVVGTYAANQPFAVRVDIDMSAKNWAVAVDNELNGFADDPITTNLPFENPVNVLPNVAEVHASFSIFPVIFEPGSVAYDNISISRPSAAVPEPSPHLLISLGLVVISTISSRRREADRDGVAKEWLEV